MKRYILVVISIFVIITLTGCSTTVQSISVEKEPNKISMTIETPHYFTNSVKFNTLDENKILLPIKSFKVLKSVGDLEISLIKPASRNDFEFRKAENTFYYKDMNKYSVVQYKFDNANYENIDNKNFACHYYAAVEIEFYPDEVLDTKINNTMNYCNYSLICLANPYMGKLINARIDGTRDEKNKSIDIKDIYKYAGEGIQQTYDVALHDYFKDPEFLKAAEEVKSTFDSERSDKIAIAISNWIVKNIENADIDESKNTGDAVPESYRCAKEVLKNKKAVCMGYAYLFQAFAEYFDLNSQVIYGKTSPERPVFHDWNIIRLEDDSIFYIDLMQNEAAYAPNEIFESKHLVWDLEQEKYIPYKAY